VAAYKAPESSFFANVLVHKVADRTRNFLGNLMMSRIRGTIKEERPIDVAPGSKFEAGKGAEHHYAGIGRGQILDCLCEGREFLIRKLVGLAQISPVCLKT